MPRNVVARPEIWAGVECTVNRVGDRYFEQLERSGHARRPDDLDRIAVLGAQAIRYPILWERETPDWAWADDRLARLRRLGVRPIAGLLHHGSGPPHTSLVDPHFAEGLAAYAARVAGRYPWIDVYTPVNEPLTTARFSGLYGHWYPHGRDDRTFVRCLLNQCRATVLAMLAIRRFNPAAELVQTEDIGHVHSTPALAYQAHFENERRWLSWDLLCGRVDRRHVMWNYLRENGATARELTWFRANACPPGVLGINYYVTSERYLDDCTDRYPPHLHGGNGRHRYVDTEAVRILADGGLGLENLLRMVADRYRLPIAITDVHLGCSREEQLRWLAEVWRTACGVREAGLDLRAVTVWSAFGAFDWNSLVTRSEGYYEPGAFDVRCEPPRPTAVAKLVRQMASGAEPDHPALDTPGWWRRPERLSFARPPLRRLAGRPLMIAGGGSLGSALARVCRARGLASLRFRHEGALADANAVAGLLERSRPWAVIHAAAPRGLDRAERDPARCERENVLGPVALAAACAERDIRFATFSSGHVFDGCLARPYLESDPASPLNVFGAAKAEAERRILALDPTALLVRTSELLSPWDGGNFAARTVRTLGRGATVNAADDLVTGISYVPDLCHDTLDLLADGESGVWHLAAPDPVTWCELARTIAHRAGLSPRILGRPARSFGWVAPRSPYSVLGSGRSRPGATLDHSLARFVRDFDPGSAL